jgi:hypothetical protein
MYSAKRNWVITMNGDAYVMLISGNTDSWTQHSYKALRMSFKSAHEAIGRMRRDYPSGNFAILTTDELSILIVMNS